MKNPYFVGDQAGATQLSGWTGAWESTPSRYVVRATDARDVAAAVAFARDHDLRLVVKGGGHAYQGTSSAPDSLLVWTHAMRRVDLHDRFVADGCPPGSARPAVTIDAGALWMDVYDTVTNRAGRYVQGGGCATVGVAGLVQSGGFGSFSKRFGLAAASLLEAEIVTADARVRTVNRSRDPELFWALQGGGGGTFGVVTRLTLATHPLPEILGDVSLTLAASSDVGYQALLTEFVAFYRSELFNRHWGEQVNVSRSNRLRIEMVFESLEKDAVSHTWKQFIERATSIPGVTVEKPFFIEALPGRGWWDVDYLQKYSLGSVTIDPRPGAPRSHAWWTGDGDQVGEITRGYRSLWLPAELLTAQPERLARSLFEASRHWSVGLHFNKGLAGAPDDVVAAAKATATNSRVADAFALAIVSGGVTPSMAAGSPRDPEPAKAQEYAANIDRAMRVLNELAPDGGSYLAEGDYFESSWQRAFWGENYERLLAIKRTYDPDSVFFVHHGVGSEGWSDDGFTRSA